MRQEPLNKPLCPFRVQTLPRSPANNMFWQRPACAQAVSQEQTQKDRQQKAGWRLSTAELPAGCVICMRCHSTRHLQQPFQGSVTDLITSDALSLELGLELRRDTPLLVDLRLLDVLSSELLQRRQNTADRMCTWLKGGDSAPEGERQLLLVLGEERNVTKHPKDIALPADLPGKGRQSGSRSEPCLERALGGDGLRRRRLGIPAEGALRWQLPAKVRQRYAAATAGKRARWESCVPLRCAELEDLLACCHTCSKHDGGRKRQVSKEGTRRRQMHLLQRDCGV